MDKNRLFRKIPKVDILLENETIQKMMEYYGREVVVDAVRSATEQLRQVIGRCTDETEAEKALETLPAEIEKKAASMSLPHICPVMNGTGTILHTNLGRAPISQDQIKYIGAVASGYSNLEYNLERGTRGERYAHFEEILCKLTGAEAAIAVNNNAAAVMLILSSLAKGGEAIVSRGELVEVGGKFRIPDVMEQSGASLVEVGTTNKTHYSDYEEAIGEETKVLLKVHTSNYRIMGFTETVPVAELVKLGREHDLPVVEDLGSGVLFNLEKYGLSHEPTIQESVQAGADLVCFSGDKLLGGPQAGLIVGKKKYIDQLKKNQLMRALRVDKFTVAALDVILRDYLSEEKAVEKIPVLKMIARDADSVKKNAQKLCRQLKKQELPATFKVEASEAQIGGGSLPAEYIPSWAVTIQSERISVEKVEERLRKMPMPAVCRTADDKIWVDMRTFDERWIPLFVKELKEHQVLES